jgi:hypothetical protein
MAVLIEELCKIVETAISEKPTVETLMKTAVVLAEKVNSIPGVKGADKKKIVMKLLEDGLNKCVQDVELRSNLLVPLQTVVPLTLDIAVSVANGNASLKKPTLNCLLSLFGRCVKSVSVPSELLDFVTPKLVVDVEKPEEQVEVDESLKDQAQIGQSKSVDESVVQVIDSLLIPVLDLFEPLPSPQSVKNKEQDQNLDAKVESSDQTIDELSH